MGTASFTGTATTEVHCSSTACKNTDLDAIAPPTDTPSPTEDTWLDPRDAEAALIRQFKGVQPGLDAKRAVAEFVDQRIESKEDVPMVEDFPLAPEEETPDFQHLATSLQFRLVRAFEHWRGNTHLTLTAIVVRTLDEHTRTGN